MRTAIASILSHRGRKVAALRSVEKERESVEERESEIDISRYVATVSRKISYGKRSEERELENGRVRVSNGVRSLGASTRPKRELRTYVYRRVTPEGCGSSLS